MLYKITIEKVFTLDTLSENVRKKVLDTFRYMNVEDSWWYEDIMEYWKIELEKLGFVQPIIHFSGFWNQGDGASFTAETIDLETYLKAHKLGKQYRATLNAARQGYARLSLIRDQAYRYVHEYTIKVVDETLYVNDKAQAQIDLLSSHILETARQLSRTIYKELETTYDDYTADEKIAVTLLDSGYQFNEAGQII